MSQIRAEKNEIIKKNGFKKEEEGKVEDYKQQ